MKKYILIFCMISSVTTVFGQNNFKRNDIYLEAGGNGLFGSVNYERQLTKQPGIGARIGVGIYSEKGSYLTLPIGINYLFKFGAKSFLDAGLATTFTTTGINFFRNSEFNGDDFINLIPTLGYRTHTTNNVMWRISLSPIINKYVFVPWIGVSLGKRF